LAAGRKTPIVRLVGFRYAAATFCTSSTVALRMRSRLMKKRRQSPWPMYSERSKPTRSALFKSRSMFFSRFARERSTSSFVTGAAPAASSRVFTRAAFASATD
jgi:hypothetical protein